MSLIYFFFPFADNNAVMNTNLWLLPSATNDAEHFDRTYSSLSPPHISPLIAHALLSRRVSIEDIGRMEMIEESLFDSV